MARIAGINIPDEKRLEASLPYIYGIGPSLARKIIAQGKLSPDTRVKDLSETELDRIREIVDKNYKVEGELRAEITQNIRRIKDIGTYRGTRHTRNLPVRGQRTRTNARTKRGKKVTVSSGRKRAAEKT